MRKLPLCKTLIRHKQYIWWSGTQTFEQILEISLSGAVTDSERSVKVKQRPQQQSVLHSTAPNRSRMLVSRLLAPSLDTFRPSQPRGNGGLTWRFRWIKNRKCRFVRCASEDSHLQKSAVSLAATMVTDWFGWDGRGAAWRKISWRIRNIQTFQQGVFVDG